MKELKTFITESTPTDAEIDYAYDLALKNDLCVELKWFVEYNGWLSRYIQKGVDIEKLKYNLRHIIYGL